MTRIKPCYDRKNFVEDFSSRNIFGVPENEEEATHEQGYRLSFPKICDNYVLNHRAQTRSDGSANQAAIKVLEEHLS